MVVEYSKQERIRIEVNQLPDKIKRLEGGREWRLSGATGENSGIRARSTTD